MRILIVDDDCVAVKALSHALEQFGHDTVAASNGLEALDVLRTDKIRLIITDWQMPEMDGLDLCRQVRREHFGGYTYVILLTSRRDQRDLIKGLNAGADDFLCKPFDPEELQVRIRAAERILTLETREVAIFAMAKLADSRDPETGEHLERMRDYCRILAGDLASCRSPKHAVDAEYVRLIYLTSPLHDIGKVGIPDSVLLKPGRLSDREFDIMKCHTTIGAETLEAASAQYPGVPYLRIAEQIALTHHERYDGSGYPKGISGDDIPLCGRIVALADVYDALTSKRVYKDAFTHDVARSIILDESGKHFDPAIVEAFMRTEKRFVEARARFSECQLTKAEV